MEYLIGALIGIIAAWIGLLLWFGLEAIETFLEQDWNGTGE